MSHEKQSVTRRLMNRLDHPAVHESTVVSRLSAVCHRLTDAVSKSRTHRILEPASRSAPVSGSRDGAEPTEDAGSSIVQASPVTTNSSVLQWGTQTAKRLGRALRQSNPYWLATHARHVVECSWLYRWLTAEPDQEVIVIDLRETITVGPWLAAIQRALEWLLPAAVSSVLFGFARRVHLLVTDRPVQLLGVSAGVTALALLGLAVVFGISAPGLYLLVMALGLFAVGTSRITWSWEELAETRGYQLLADAFEPPDPPDPLEPRGSATSARIDLTEDADSPDEDAKLDQRQVPSQRDADTRPEHDSTASQPSDDESVETASETDSADSKRAHEKQEEQ